MSDIKDPEGFCVKSLNGRFMIQDNADHQYGSYSTKEEAEAAVKDWEAYYAQ